MKKMAEFAILNQEYSGDLSRSLQVLGIMLIA
jgi:hypothetical protein